MALSCTGVNGAPTNGTRPTLNYNIMQIEEELRRSAQLTVEAKGAASFGIASAVSVLCTSILLDRRITCTISHYQPGMGCCLSLPATLGRHGISETLDTQLDKDQTAKLRYAASNIRDDIEALHLAWET